MQTPQPEDAGHGPDGVEGAGGASGGENAFGSAGDASGFWRRYSGRGEETGRGAKAGRDEEPAQDGRDVDHECLDWCPICRGAELVKSAVPPEVADQFQVLQRDALLMVQALVEAQLAKLREQDAGGDSDLTSIPIE